jgi:hypothetical protein
MPLEFETYPCGECGKPVETEWCSDGLLPGPYELLGEVFFHKPDCVDKYLAAFSEACRTSEHSNGEQK